MDAYEEIFICDRCNNPFIVGIVNIVKDQAHCIVKCKKGHKKIIKLPMDDKMKWIVPLTKYIYQCRCGAELTDLKMSTSGGITYLTLYCKKHKERSRKIPSILWTLISNTRMQLSEDTLIVLDEKELPPPPESTQQSLQQNSNPIITPQAELPQNVATISIPQEEPTTTNHSFCPICGEPLPEGATKFCPSCGMEL
ncbi:MAG: zinc ribbon domain-containing protein [Candidatus Helarchaeota archaeon]